MCVGGVSTGAGACGIGAETGAVVETTGSGRNQMYEAVAVPDSASIAMQRSPARLRQARVRRGATVAELLSGSEASESALSVGEDMVSPRPNGDGRSVQSAPPIKEQSLTACGLKRFNVEEHRWRTGAWRKNTMFTVVVTERGGAQRRIEFDSSEVTIGRVQGNDVVLPKGNVSKRHCRIVHKDGRFVVVDLKSTNGTYVNGRKITSPLVVRAGDKVYVGDFILTIDDAAADAQAPIEEPVEQTEAQVSDAALEPPEPVATLDSSAGAVVDPGVERVEPMFDDLDALSGPGEEAIEDEAAPVPPEAMYTIAQSEPDEYNPPLAPSPPSEPSPPSQPISAPPPAPATAPPRMTVRADASDAPPAKPRPASVPVPAVARPSSVAPPAARTASGTPTADPALVLLVETALSYFEDHKVSMEAATKAARRAANELDADGRLASAIAQRHLDSVVAELAGLGPLEGLLEEPTTLAIVVAADGAVAVDAGSGFMPALSGFASSMSWRHCAARLRASFAPGALPGLHEGVLSGGARALLLDPPLASGGTRLELQLGQRPGNLMALSRLGALDTELAQALQDAVNCQQGIVVLGSDRQAVTQAVGALAEALPTDARVALVQGPYALTLSQPHVAEVGYAAGDAALQLGRLNLAMSLRAARLVQVLTPPDQLENTLRVLQGAEPGLILGALTPSPKQGLKALRHTLAAAGASEAEQAMLLEPISALAVSAEFDAPGTLRIRQV